MFQWIVKMIKTILKILLYALPIIIASISLCFDCRQDIKIENISYDQMAMAHRPDIKIEKGSLFKVYSREKVINLDNYLETNLQKKDSVSSVSIDIDSLRFDLLLKNTGNAIAKIHQFIFTDTTTGKDYIRKVITDKKLREQKLLSYSTLKKYYDYYNHNYYNVRHIAPNDSLEIYFTKPIFFKSGHTFTLHFIILYSNDASVLFDTYGWAKFKTSKGYRIPLIPHHSLVIDNKFMKNVISVIVNGGSHTEPHKYSKQEAEDILEFLRSNQIDMQQY